MSLPILPTDIERVAREFGCSLEEAATELRMYALQEAIDWKHYGGLYDRFECIACGRPINGGKKCLDCLT